MGCGVSMFCGCCSASGGIANLRSDKSRARGRPDSNGVEYLDEIPVTAEGSINMIAVWSRTIKVADSDAQAVVLVYLE